MWVVVTSSIKGPGICRGAFQAGSLREPDTFGCSEWENPRQDHGSEGLASDFIGQSRIPWSEEQPAGHLAVPISSGFEGRCCGGKVKPVCVRSLRDRLLQVTVNGWRMVLRELNTFWVALPPPFTFLLYSCTDMWVGSRVPQVLLRQLGLHLPETFSFRDDAIGLPWVGLTLNPLRPPRPLLCTLFGASAWSGGGGLPFST